MVMVMAAAAAAAAAAVVHPDETPHSRVKRWEDFPNATFTFDCTGRSIGFYADLEFDCMVRSVHINLISFFFYGKSSEVCSFRLVFLGPDLPPVRRSGQADPVHVRQEHGLQPEVPRLRLGIQRGLRGGAGMVSAIDR